MTTQQLLDEMTEITSNNLEVIRKRLIFLNADQRSWRPNKNAWSINDIFAHLNQYVQFYHKTFNNAIETTKHRDPISVFMPSPLGKSAWKSMKLGNAKNVKRKFRSQRSFNPSIKPELITGHDVEDFESAQKELITIIERSAEVNMRKTKVPIASSKIIRLRLSDAMLFVVYHNERHIQQALNVVNHPMFPRRK